MTAFKPIANCSTPGRRTVALALAVGALSSTGAQGQGTNPWTPQTSPAAPVYAGDAGSTAPGLVPSNQATNWGGAQPTSRFAPADLEARLSAGAPLGQTPPASSASAPQVYAPQVYAPPSYPPTAMQQPPQPQQPAAQAQSYTTPQAPTAPTNAGPGPYYGWPGYGVPAPYGTSPGYGGGLPGYGPGYAPGWGYGSVPYAGPGYGWGNTWPGTGFSPFGFW